LINELNRMAEAIRNAGIQTETWHSKYVTIPKIRPDAPCIRILIKDGMVGSLRSVDAESGKTLRKFGNNQGSFPAMNLAPLFRIDDKEKSDTIAAWIKAGGVGTDIKSVHEWCSVNNWNEKFTNKFRISMCDRASGLRDAVNGRFKPLDVLLEAITPLQDSEKLHQQLCEAAFSMIEAGDNVRLALQILFYLANPKKSDDYGSLSVIFDCKELEEQGIPTVSIEFTRKINTALLAEKPDAANELHDGKTDAFGILYQDVGDTLPKITLPAGFDVTLRTMFSGQPCQYRYEKIENDSYPLSGEKSMEIKTALEWLAKEDNRDKTWTKTGKSEVFFAYPSKLPKAEDGWNTVQTFCGDDGNREAEFIAVSENFSEYICKTKKLDLDNYPEYIQLLALNKYDKARTRIAYSRSTTPDTVIEQSIQWQRAADNLPSLWRLNKPKVLFPLSVAPVMNRIWKRDGTQASDKYRHTNRYHGVDLFFGVPGNVLLGSLGELMRNAENMAVYASTALRSKQANSKNTALFLKNLKDVLSLMGMYLYWMGIRKDYYMNEYPYIFGQLLKVSDAVHELYCMKVRNGQIPTQLVGSALYASAAELPLQTFSVLSTRIQPYLSWCKANREENVEWADKNGGKHRGLTAGYFVHQYEILADKLKEAFSQQPRFSDAEKAQLFIGYLASFEKTKNDSDGLDEEGENENDE